MAEEHNPQETAEESERLSRLASSPPVDDETERDAAAVVREYEERYSPQREEKPKRDHKDIPRSYSTLRVSDEERRWAALAHGSVWLTLVAGILSGGALVPFLIFVPLGIYFAFRKQSDYVAFHALQAFVLQILGTVGAITLLLVGGVIWAIGMVIAALLVVVLVGIVLVPVWAIVGIALVLTVVLLPLAMLLLGTVAALETYNHHDYRYPLIARWIDRQMAGGFLNV